MKKYLIILLISLILIATISNVSAEDTFTITVTDKHITGNSGDGAYGGPLFIITDDSVRGVGDCIIYSKDYYKINVQDTVTLKNTNNGYCEVISINNQEINHDGWC